MGDQRVNKVKSVHLDLPVLLESKDLKERMVKRENKVFKDPKVLLESEVQSEKTDPRVTLDLSVSLVTPVLLDPLVSLETTEPPVETDLLEPLVHQESKVLLDYKDYQDLLASPVFQEALVLMVLLELRVPKVLKVSRETLVRF